MKFRSKLYNNNFHRSLSLAPLARTRIFLLVPCALQVCAIFCIEQRHWFMIVRVVHSINYNRGYEIKFLSVSKFIFTYFFWETKCESPHNCLCLFVFLLLTWVTSLLVRFAIEEGDSTLSSWALHLDFKQQEIFFFISTTLKQRSKEDMKCKIVLHHLLTTRSSCNPTSCSRGRCWGALKLVFSFMKTIYIALLVNNIFYIASLV